MKGKKPSKYKTKLLKKIKKDKIYQRINLKEINIQNDPKNNIFFGTGRRIPKSYPKKFKKTDIKNQISSLTYLLNDYTKKSIKNLGLINELKTENDFLISELDKNLQKSVLFNKTTEEVFHNLIIQYNQKGYKIPNLNRSHNLFKRTPLLIENREDVDIYYKDDPSTKGNFIEDMNQFKEKNWLFLNKLNNECNIAKNIYSAKAMNANDNKEFNDEYDIKLNKTQNQIKRMDSIEKNKNNINNLMTEIENIKKAIQVEEQKEIYSYGTKFKRRAGPRKFTQLASISNLISKVNNSNSAVNNINQSNSIKKKFVRQSTLKVQTPKNIFGMKKRLSILKNNNNNINKNINKRKSDFNLITEVNKKSKNLNNFRNSIFSFDKKIYCPINIKVPGSEKIKKDLNSYFEKYTQKYGDEVLTDSNIDLLKKIGETRRIIKKKDILGIHNNFFSYSRKHYKRAKLLEKLEKRLCNLDKYFVKQTVMKSFDNTYT